MLVLLFTYASFSQTRKSAVGTLVSSEGGNHIGTVCLNIKGKTLCFEWASPPSTNTTKYPSTTKFRGFQKGKPWKMGAEWRITYYYDKNRDVFVLSDATFSGRVLSENNKSQNTLPSKIEFVILPKEALEQLKHDDSEVKNIVEQGLIDNSSSNRNFRAERVYLNGDKKSLPRVYQSSAAIQ